MKIRFLSGLCLVILLNANTVKAAELESIGTFDFPSSGSAEAHAHFTLGVGYLHSFGWKQAQDEFRKAQELEPDFALAYWGETFTYNHPFLGEWDAEGPADAIKRLGASSEERLSKAPTEREKGFVRAAEAYALTEGPVGNKRTAWMNAMTELYEKFPEDREVAAFYAVSLLSGATAAGDQRERLNMLAGSLAVELFRQNENHPGAAHYIIHAFDDPIHAPLALVAARKYAEIAPAVAHARHMPTHIFIQHGMWPEVSQWNESSFTAATELWLPGDRPNDLNHSSDWGQYGDLQMANYDRAQQWIERARVVQENNPGDARSAITVRTLEARMIIESQQWQIDTELAQQNAEELLATGLSAANLGDLELASDVAATLQAMVDKNPDNGNLRISQIEVAALTKLKQGSAQITAGKMQPGKALQEEALALLAEGVELDESQRLPNGAASPLKPVHELYGEALLEAGKPELAAAQFEQSLRRMPNRSWSLLGAARSYAAQNQREEASLSYQALQGNLQHKNVAAYQEAETYLKSF